MINKGDVEMAIKFLSFLGTGDYVPVYYVYKNGKSSFTPFIQHALLEFVLQEETAPTETVIFVTKEAKEKNWSKLQNLFSELKEMHPNFTFKYCDIPSGQSEDIIWEVFRIVYDVICEEDDVIYDITHSFRYQPMLALLILHFARVTKNIHIRGIYYGNSEKLGPLNKIRDMDEKARLAEVVDLSSFVDLQEWITGVYAFVHSGRVDSLVRMIDAKSRGIRKLERKSTPDIKVLEQFIQNWSALTSTLQTCRMSRIAENAALAHKYLISLKEIHVRPEFSPITTLLDRVERQIKSMVSKDYLETGLGAICWCLEHGLTQQAFTMLRELVISLVCLMKDPAFNLQDNRQRDSISELLNIAVKKYLEKKNVEEPDFDEERKIIQRLGEYPELLTLYKRVRDDRNDLNHAGYNKDNKNASAFEYLSQNISQYTHVLRKFWEHELQKEGTISSQ
jgi:CRISPR-associated Csx2 family protein